MVFRTENAGDETVALDRLSRLAARPDEFSEWVRAHAEGAVVRISSGKDEPVAFLVDEQTLSAAATAVAVLQIVLLDSPLSNPERGVDAYGDLLRHARVFDSLPGVQRRTVNQALVDIACSIVPTGMSHDVFARSIDLLDPREMAVEIKQQVTQRLSAAGIGTTIAFGTAVVRAGDAVPPHVSPRESFGMWDNVAAYAAGAEDEVIRVADLSREEAERLTRPGPASIPAGE